MIEEKEVSVETAVSNAIQQIRQAMLNPINSEVELAQRSEEFLLQLGRQAQREREAKAEAEAEAESEWHRRAKEFINADKRKGAGDA